MQEGSPPEAGARAAPEVLRCAASGASSAASAQIGAAIGAARRNASAVAANPSRARRPRREYQPQDAPAPIIAAAAAGGGACAPGSVSPASPQSATTRPIQTRAGGRSPWASAAANMVVWTAPKSSSAPTPAPTLKYAQEKGAA